MDTPWASAAAPVDDLNPSSRPPFILHTCIVGRMRASPWALSWWRNHEAHSAGHAAIHHARPRGFHRRGTRRQLLLERQLDGRRPVSADPGTDLVAHRL